MVFENDFVPLSSKCAMIEQERHSRSPLTANHVFLFAEPNFVGSYDVGEYVMFFFRETAVEYINCGKNIYSRVARVCKKDVGGKNLLTQNWATYVKARLNCSIPGEFPFYFNEIRESPPPKKKKKTSTSTKYVSLPPPPQTPSTSTKYEIPQKKTSEGGAICGALCHLK